MFSFFKRPKQPRFIMVLYVKINFGGTERKYLIIDTVLSVIVEQFPDFQLAECRLFLKEKNRRGI